MKALSIRIVRRKRKEKKIKMRKRKKQEQMLKPKLLQETTGIESGSICTPDNSTSLKNVLRKFQGILMILRLQKISGQSYDLTLSMAKFV